jgi:hypothetical protein
MFEAITRGKEYIDRAVEYETKSNEYKDYRDNAYLETAKLYLAQGDRANAQSYATTAVELSGSRQYVAGESLIRQIIEYSAPKKYVFFRPS